MHASVRNWLLAASLASLGATLGESAALADTGLNLPSAPHGPGGEDSIETGDGTRCRQSINSNGAYFDVGIAGRAAQPMDQRADLSPYYYPRDRDAEGAAYARLTIPLGQRPRRLDCSRLYEIELARLRREIELLRMAAE